MCRIMASVIMIFSKVSVKGLLAYLMGVAGPWLARELLFPKEGDAPRPVGGR